LRGAFSYFAEDEAIIDDTDGESINLRLRTHVADSPNCDEDTESNPAPFEFDNEDDPRSDILASDKNGIMEAVADIRILKYQLPDLQVSPYIWRLGGLLGNTFIMERLDDDKIRVIVRLVRAMKMLDSFLQHHDDLAVRSGITIIGYEMAQDGDEYRLFY